MKRMLLVGILWLCVNPNLVFARPCSHNGLMQQQLADVIVFINPQPNDVRSKAKHIVRVKPLRFAVAAASSYKDWKNSMEDLFGNLDFQGLIQVKTAKLHLGLEVGVDGSTQNVRLQQSSGNPAVDDAVEKAISGSVPWPTLPVKWLKASVGNKPIPLSVAKTGYAHYVSNRSNLQHYGVGVQIVWPEPTVQSYKISSLAQINTRRMQ